MWKVALQAGLVLLPQSQSVKSSENMPNLNFSSLFSNTILLGLHLWLCFLVVLPILLLLLLLLLLPLH